MNMNLNIQTGKEIKATSYNNTARFISISDLMQGILEASISGACIEDLYKALKHLEAVYDD